MYFGPQRETDHLDGHVKIDLQKTEFAVLGLNDYGGFTYLGDEVPLPEITDSIYRQIHDELLGLDVEDENKLEGYRYFPRKDTRISANIGFGDDVTNTETGDRFIVDNNHDLRYINRNQFYYPTHRPGFRPKPISRSKYIELTSQINPLIEWKPCENPNVKKWHRILSFKTLDKHVTAYSDKKKDIYYLDVNGAFYQKRSNISAPFWDTIRDLRNEVYNHYDDGKRFTYVLYEIESDEQYFRPVVMTDDFSLHYNNAVINNLGINP